MNDNPPLQQLEVDKLAVDRRMAVERHKLEREQLVADNKRHYKEEDNNS